MLFKIFVFELQIELSGGVDHMLHLDVILDVLHVFEDSCELSSHDDLPAVHYYRNSNKTDEPKPVLRGEDAFPDAEGVKESKILGKEQGNPPEAVEKGVYF